MAKIQKITIIYSKIRIIKILKIFYYFIYCLRKFIILSFIKTFALFKRKLVLMQLGRTPKILAKIK